jgi:PTH1 family peptidyl-tRNA hydrolase
MKIIAGLGNPGAAYQNTPHSVGFEVLDAFAAVIGASWELKKSFKAMLAGGVYAGQRVLLVKPQTFMNLSGESLQPAVKYHNATAAELLVVHDDIDLPLGRMRLRKNGSAGGHNGVRNIIERLGTPEFSRLKLGVGKDPSDVIAHVLGKFPPAARKVMDVVVADAVNAVGAWIERGCDRAMNEYNGYSAAK